MANKLSKNETSSPIFAVGENTNSGDPPLPVFSPATCRTTLNPISHFRLLLGLLQYNMCQHPFTHFFPLFLTIFDGRTVMNSPI